MKRSEEIIFAVKTISPKEGDIVIVNSSCMDKRTKHELSKYFTENKLKCILLDDIKPIDDVISLASDESLKRLGLMRIPKE